LIQSSPIYQAIYHSQLGEGVEKIEALSFQEVENV